MFLPKSQICFLAITLSIWFAEGKNKFAWPITHVNRDEYTSPYLLIFHHRMEFQIPQLADFLKKLFNHFMVALASIAPSLHLEMQVEKSFLSTVILPNACTASLWQKWKLSCLQRCAAVPLPEFRIQGLPLIMPINITTISPVKPLGGLPYKSIQGWDIKGAKGESWQERDLLHFSPLKRQFSEWMIYSVL